MEVEILGWVDLTVLYDPESSIVYILHFYYILYLMIVFSKRFLSSWTILVFVGLSAVLSAQTFNADFIRYLDEDGLTYKDYTKVQSLGFNSWHYIKKDKNPKDEYSFISPSDYKIIPLINEDYNQILFNQGSFSLIKEDTLTEEVVINDGLYIFQNDVEKDNDGYYGCFAKPKGFKTLNYVWVFPKNIKVESYESNRDGQWRLENNTLSYIGYGQNNVLFKITYRLAEKIPLHLTNRDVVLKDTVNVTHKAITISIWDDSKIDNDVISIKLNDEWIVKYLEAKKDKVKFKYFLTQPENYIILRADNIGEIPPNTTAINIDDGTNSRTIVLNSDMGMSEAIRINLNTE